MVFIDPNPLTSRRALRLAGQSWLRGWVESYRWVKTAWVIRHGNPPPPRKGRRRA